MPLAAIWMGSEIIIVTEVSQRQIPHDITCAWKLRHDASEPIYETESCQRSQTGGWQGAEGWWGEVSKCKLLYTEWINNKVLLYSTGNYIQYPIMEKNIKRCI